VSTRSTTPRRRARAGIWISDITPEVGEAVRRSGVNDGICLVTATTAACAVRVNEFESGFFADFESLLARLVPHDEDLDEEAAARRRLGCLAMLLGPAGESIPVRDGALRLGQWQRVLFVELARDDDRVGDWSVGVVGA
jgi:secondary thiamine-phosphate synthase enzyme